MGNFDAVKKALKRKAPGRTQGGDINSYKLPQGTEEVRLRLLPPWKGSDFPIKPQMTHFELPTDDEGKGGVSKCLALFDMKCPICKVIEEFEDRLDKGVRQAATLGGEANVLIRRDPTQNINAKMPHVVQFSAGILKFIEEVAEDEGEGGIENLCDPHEAYDLIIKRKKKKGGFEVRTTMKPTPISDDKKETKTILAGLVDLDALRRQPNDDDIVRIKEAASRLRDHFENVVLTSAGKVSSSKDQDGDDSDDGDDDTRPIKKSKKDKPSSSLKPKKKKKLKKGKLSAAAQSSIVKRPPKAPECFADRKVYDPDSEQCQGCDHEYECKVAIKKLKMARIEAKRAKEAA